MIRNKVIWISNACYVFYLLEVRPWRRQCHITGHSLWPSSLTVTVVTHCDRHHSLWPSSLTVTVINCCRSWGQWSCPTGRHQWTCAPAVLCLLSATTVSVIMCLSLLLWTTLQRHPSFIATSILATRHPVIVTGIRKLWQADKSLFTCLTRQYVCYPSWRCTVNGTLWDACSTSKMTI